MWIAWIKPLLEIHSLWHQLPPSCIHNAHQLICTSLKAQQNCRPGITLVSIISVMKKLHFLMVVVWVQVTLIFPIILTNCLEYPTTLTSPQGFNSKFPFNFWLSWSYTFNGIAFTSVPVSWFVAYSKTPVLFLCSKIFAWVEDFTGSCCLACWGRQCIEL